MKKLILAGISMAALATAVQPAAAADLSLGYRAPQNYVIFTWTGFYFGAHGGGAWGRKEETIAPFTFGRTVLTPANTTIDISGGLAGGQIGANYQAGSWVLGVEADVSWARSHRQHFLCDRHCWRRGELPGSGERAGYVGWPTRLRTRPDAAVRQGRRCIR